MTAVMIRKNNLYCDLHGWRPKYFHDNFRRELNTRIQNKIMFASNYPFFPYDKLFGDWEAIEIKPEVIQNVYLNTARKVLGLEKQSGLGRFSRYIRYSVNFLGLLLFVRASSLVAIFLLPRSASA